MADSKIVGYVKNAAFVPFSEAARRLTSIQPQEAVPPEAGEIDLYALEGRVIEITGIDQDNWIYNARVDVGSQYFRASVGIILVNPGGLVLALERAEEYKDPTGTTAYRGTNQWQMPQGGLDELEEPKTGSEREFDEELGRNARSKSEFCYEHPEWLTYELPPDDRSAKHGRGQTQKWFVYRFLGNDSDINLSGDGHKREFMQHKWMPLADLARLTWSVRRPTYERLATDLKEYMHPI